MKKILLLLYIIIFYSKLNATHGLPFVGFSYSVTSTGILINASSDPATCGIGPYWMQVYVSCSAITSQSISMSSAMQYTLSNWNSTGYTHNDFPWFNSLLNVPNYDLANSWPDGCTVEPYHSVFVPFSLFNPGSTLYFMAREWIGGTNSAGPFTSIYSVTIPGILPPPISFSLTSTTNSICPFTPLSVGISTITGGPISSYSWSPSIGTGSTAIVSPSVTTSYSLTVYSDVCSYTTESLNIDVIPIQFASFSPTNNIICTNSNQLFTSVSSSISSSHQWNITPNTGFVVNNSLTSANLDVNFMIQGNYIITHTTVSTTCIDTASTNLLVSICTENTENINLNSFSVFPNPTSNQLTIRSQDDNKVAQFNVIVTDISGHIIEEKQMNAHTNLTIDCSLWNDGMYFIDIKNESVSYHYKVIKL